MKKWLTISLAAIVTLTSVIVATADYTIKDAAGTTQTILAFVCATTKICPAHVIINSSGTELATSSNPLQVSLANTAANSTAVKVDPSAVTSPVSLASVPSHAVTNAGTFATQAAQSGTWTVQPGNTANTTPWLVTQSSDYPSAATAITASATGTTAATTATLAGTSAKITYICSLSIRSNATAAVTGDATVTGTITGTLHYNHWTAPVASGVGVTEQIFSPCVPASATNTGIAVISPAPGTGGVVSVTATGYQL